MRIMHVRVRCGSACELIHYGMELVHGKRTIYDVMSSLFTAVTFHELFKAAALDGNSKLAFGVQWKTIFKALSETFNKDDLESVRAKFDELDKDNSGGLDAEELQSVFKDIGKTVSVGTIANMLRLADDDGTGTISFDEFASIIQAIH